MRQRVIFALQIAALVALGVKECSSQISGQGEGGGSVGGLPDLSGTTLPGGRNPGSAGTPGLLPGLPGLDGILDLSLLPGLSGVDASRLLRLEELFQSLESLLPGLFGGRRSNTPGGLTGPSGSGIPGTSRMGITNLPGQGGFPSPSGGGIAGFSGTGLTGLPDLGGTRGRSSGGEIPRRLEGSREGVSGFGPENIPGQRGRPGQPGRLGRPGQPGQPGRPGRPGRPGLPGQPGRLGP